MANIDTAIRLSGDKEFKQSVRQMQNELGLFKSGLAAITAEYANNENSVDGLRLKQDNLKQQIEKGNEILEIARQRLEQYRQSGDAGSEASLKMQNTVIQIRTALAEMGNELQVVNGKLSDAMGKGSAFTTELDSSRQSLESIEKTLDVYESQLTALEREYQKSGAALQLTAQKQDVLRAAFAESQGAVQELENQLSLLGTVVDENSEEYKDLVIKLNEAKAKMHDLENAIGTTTEKILKMGQRLKDIGEGMSKYLTLPLTAAGGAIVKVGADFESAFAGVQQTVKTTEESYQRLRQGILDMDIPVDPAIISFAMETAGQLGIAEESLLSFSRTIVDMGEASNMSVADAAAEMAKFANITQMAHSDIERLGSVIIMLGNNLATQEREVSALGMNLAAAGQQAGMSAADIMAFAGALSSLGVEAAKGGTSASKLFRDISTAVMSGGADLQKFASIAGESADTFKVKFEKDAAKAIAAFLKGLGDIKNSGGDLNATLSDLGITESRMIDVISRLALSGDLLENALDMANQAWIENTALTEKAGKRYETTTSQIQLFLRDLKVLGIEISDVMLPTIKGVIGFLRDIIGRLKDMDDGTKEFIVRAGLVVAALGPVLSALGSLITMVVTVRGAFLVMSTGAAAATPSIYNLSVAMAAATKAAAALSVSIMGIPLIGWIVGGVTVAVTAGVAAWNKYKKSQEEATQAIAENVQELAELKDQLQGIDNEIDNIHGLAEEWKQLKLSLKDTTATAEELAKAKEELAEKEKQLITLSDGMISQQDIENGLLDERLQALDQEYDKKREIYEIALKQKLLEVDQDALIQQKEEQVKQVDELIAAYNRQEDTLSRLSKAMVEYDNLLANRKSDNEWINNINKIRGELDGLLTEVGVAVPAGFRTYSDAVEDLNRLMSATSAELLETQEALENTADILDDYTKIQKELNGVQKAATIAIQDTTDAYEWMERGAADLASNQDRLNESIANGISEVDDLEKAFETLSKGESLNLDQVMNLIDTYPAMAEHLAKTGDLTFENGEIARIAAETRKEAILAELKAEQEQLKAEIDVAKERLESTKQLYTGMIMAGGEYIDFMRTNSQALGFIKDLEEQYNKIGAKISAIESISISASTRTASARGSAASKAEKAEDSALKKALESIEERAQAERWSTQERIKGYLEALEIYQGTEDEILQLTKSVTKLQQEEVIRFGNSATQAMKNFYEDSRSQAKEYLDAFKTVEQEQVEIVRENSLKKINLFSDEYIAKTRLIDEAAAREMEESNKRILSQIDEIARYDSAKAEELREQYKDLLDVTEELEQKTKAREDRRKKEKEESLLKDIQVAESEEQRLKAQAQYNDWLEEQELDKLKNEQANLSKSIENIEKFYDEQVELSLKHIDDELEIQQTITDNLQEALFGKDGRLEHINAFYDEMVKNAPKLVAELFVSGDEDALRKLNDMVAMYNPEEKNFEDYLTDSYKNNNDNLTSSLLYDPVEIQKNYEKIETLLSDQKENVTSEMMETSEQIQEILNELSNEYYVIAVQAGDGFLRGLDEKEPAIIAKAASIGEKVAQALSSVLEVFSPSRRTRRIGQFTGDGLILGIDDRVKQAGEAAARLGEAIQVKPKSLLPDTPLYGRNTYVENHFNDSGGNIKVVVENLNNANERDLHLLSEGLAANTRQVNKARGMRMRLRWA